MAVVATGLLVAGSAWAQAGPGASAVPFPLKDCVGADQRDCVANLSPNIEVHGRDVNDVDDVKPGKKRRQKDFPRCYLELWDDAAMASKRCAPEFPELTAVVPDAAIRNFFSCRDLHVPCRRDQRPDLAVSLEGGGSKSAPYALGVLAGLSEVGLLPWVDIVSSASGGSYGAYFLFSRLFENQRRGAKPGIAKSWFADCMAVEPDVVSLFSAQDQRRLTWCGSVPDAEPNGWIDWRKQDRKAYEAAFRSHFPDLFQPRFYNDVLGLHGELRSSTGFDARGLGIVGGLAFEHLLTVWPLSSEAGVPWLTGAHHLIHSAFDWPENISPSRERYREGIERAFGTSAAEYEQMMAQGPYVQTYRLRRDRHQVRDFAASYEQALETCAALGQVACGFPLWILNTTAFAGRSLGAWVETRERDSLRFQYEISPIGQGSGVFGYARRPPDDLPLMDAVGASAAFLDSDQLAVQVPGVSPLISAGLYLFNAEWGSRLPNFNVSDWQRGAHRFVPFPIWGLPLFSGRTRAPYIHIADGGNTDNLGLLPLIRRGAKHVVVAAGTDDRAGNFPSLCRAKNQLELDGTYTLRMPSLPDFDLLCNHEFDRSDRVTWGDDAVDELYCSRAAPAEGEARAGCMAGWKQCRANGNCGKGPTLGQTPGFDLFAWPAPVVAGCVLRAPLDPTATGPDACNFPETPADGAATRLISRLFVLKPALSLAAAKRQLSSTDDAKAGTSAGIAGDFCDDGWRERSDLKIARCNFGEGDLNGQPRPRTAAERLTDAELPCAALAHLVRDRCSRKDPAPDRKPNFPQDNFVTLTLNSSYLMFGAYFDLGRHQASSLLGATTPDQPVSALSDSFEFLMRLNKP
jgi:predicted acylesterase/phospholipase RssA